VRKGPLVLPRPSAADGMASSGRGSETPATSLCKSTSRTSRDNSTKVKGLTAKSVTQMNSANKDLFAVNLLYLWKFIVIHRKFVK